MGEYFVDIIGFEGIYKISNYGNIISFYNKAHKICENGILLNQSFCSYGYKQVCLCKDKKHYKIKTHQLVAIAFLNYIPKRGLVVDHINNDKTDNRLSNLQIITHRENLSKDKKTKYTGVTLKKSTNRWRAQIHINNKAEHLGYFKTEIEAHNAYQNRLKCANTIP